MDDLEDVSDEKECLSLKDILMMPDKEQDDTDTKVESYLMVDDDTNVKEKLKHGKTLIVKRMKLQFNEVECRVINFTDITSYKRLKHEEEINNLLKTLNASVHHEMIVPLRVNIDMAERLRNSLDNFPVLQQFAEHIFLASSLVLQHAYDFLDQRLIEKGIFSPNY